MRDCLRLIRHPYPEKALARGSINADFGLERYRDFWGTCPMEFLLYL